MREDRKYTQWEAPDALKEVDCKEFGGERALFATTGLELRRCVFHEGESALKCCRDIVADGCRFEGKYPFWHVDGFRVTDCVFTPGARAALWYSRNLVMKNTRVDAPKMFREMENLYLENVTVPDAQETLWSCRGVTLRGVEVKGADYLFAHSADIDIDGYRQEGNYSFQYCRDVVIRNAVIHSKDAFWETDNVTVYDSEIDGEYLGWHSRNLRLVRCRINGTQPLCYCENLVMEDCVMGPECDLAFEDSSLRATVVSQIVSVKNPRTGSLKALSIGEIITDRNILAPADCRIETEI
ncbi:MAG: DUF3737 family protein [Muribaculaceae bacterium]|nr:DUF3737 family protein [Muribaculaceae bacterium]